METPPNPPDPESQAGPEPQGEPTPQPPAPQPAPAAQPAPQPAPQPGPYAAPHYAAPAGPTIRFDVIGKAFNMVFADIGTWAVAGIVLLVGVGIVYFLLWMLMILPMLSGSFGGLLVTLFLGVVMAFAVSAVANILISNMYRMALIALGGERPSVNEMFKFGANTGNIVVGAFLVGLCTALGVIACYIGAFVVGGLLMFAMPLIVDRNMAPVDAMKLSFETLKKDVAMAAIFYFVIGLCASIGGVACGIGAVFTFPVMPLAIAMVYRDYFGAPATDAAPVATP